jgi:tripartite-type tricarboxylate transporter receptor subunit TctC
MKKILMVLACMISVTFLLGALNATAAEKFPSKAIQIVIPYGPGGGSDISARIFAKHLAKYLPSPIVITNVAGANGRAGEIQVKGAKADGYTLLWQHQTIHMAYATGRADKRWDQTFVPIATPMKAYSALVVPAKAPYKTTGDLVADVEKNPGKIRWGVGLYSSSHFALLDLVQSSKMKVDNIVLLSIPGDKDRVLAMLQGNMEATAITISSVKPYLESGDLKILGVMAEDRYKAYGQYPTCKEQGYQAVNRFDYTLYAPLGLPAERNQILADACMKTAKDPELVKEVDGLWMAPEHYVGDTLIKAIKADYDHVMKLSKDFGILDKEKQK